MLNLQLERLGLVLFSTLRSAAMVNFTNASVGCTVILAYCAAMHLG